MRIGVSFIVLSTLLGGIALGDTLVMKDGRRLEGEVSQLPDGQYRIKMPQGTMTYPASLVRTVERGALTPAANDKPAAGAAGTLPPEAQALVKAGEELEAREKHGEAAAKYEAALRLSPGNPVLTARVALALGKHGNPSRARTLLDSLRNKPEINQRAVAMLAAQYDMRLKKPERALGVLPALLLSLSEPDEEALNALGTLLSKLGDDARKGKVYADAVKTYVVHNELLEQTRPGMRRWGSQWLTASQAEVKYRELEASLQRVAEARGEVRDIDRQLRAANKEKVMLKDEDLVAAWRSKMKRLEREKDQAEQRVAKARAAVRWPPFPDEIPTADLLAPVPAEAAEAPVVLVTETTPAEHPEPAEPAEQAEPVRPEVVKADPEPAHPEPVPAEQPVAKPPTRQPPARATESGRVRKLARVVRQKLPNGLELTVEQVAQFKPAGAAAAKPKRTIFDIDDEEEPAAVKPLTLVKVTVSNPTGAGVEYVGLSGVGDLPCAWLSGDGGRRWLAVELDAGALPGVVEKQSVEPGARLSDAAVFSAEAFESRVLKLHLSGLAVGQDRSVEIILAP